MTYNVVLHLANAANYGVPQKRERVFIVGFRDDLGVRWSFPMETHTLDALMTDQWVTGEYWERHKVSKRARPEVPMRGLARVQELRQRNLRATDERQPWRTVRDAITDLPAPTALDRGFIQNHRLQLGARSYPGHTGSPIDLPAKTLKAGDHGVPGGENTVVMVDGSVRYFTVRESARLQTFPDGFAFHGSWTETMRQLGNAVPVKLAQIVAASVARKLYECALADLASSASRA